MSTLLAIDVSGSTGGSVKYWNRVFEIYLQYKPANPRLLLWDDHVEEFNEEQLRQQVRTKQGFGGTYPRFIVPFCKSGDTLILITDGEIDNSEVEICNQRLTQIKFAKVEIHFLDTGRQQNLSVAASFGSRTESYTFVVNDTVLSSGKQVGLSPYYNNPEKFLVEAEQILKDVTVATISGANMKLRDELLELQKNLLSHISKSPLKDEWTNLRELLKEQELEKAMDAIKVLIQGGNLSMAKQIEAVIREMTKQCEGKNGFSFSLLQPGRLLRAAPVPETMPAEAPVIEGSFYCPVLLEKDACCLLIRTGEPIFAGLEKPYLEYLLNAPFAILNNPDLLQKIKNRLDHPIGLEAAKSIFDRGMNSPITRADISSALIVSNEAEAIKVTNYALADLFFGGKLVALPEFWLYAVYHIIKEMEYLQPIKEAFGNMLRERMMKHKTRITLSGLPVEPMLNAPIDIAVWYSIVSVKLQPDNDANRTRSYGKATENLIEICQFLNYPYDKEFTEWYLKKCYALKWLMDSEKENKPLAQGGNLARDTLRAQYQNSILINGQRIFLDGPATDKPTLILVNLPDYLELLETVDKSKATSAIPISLNKSTKPTPEAVYNYGYPKTLQKEDYIHEVQICPQTLRPYTFVGLRHWKDLSEKKYGPLEKQISLRNYYIRYVFSNSRYPTKQEFILYLAEREYQREDSKNTLPEFIEVMVDLLLKSFEFAQNIDIGEFKKRAYASMNKEERLRLDKSGEFSNKIVINKN